MKKLPFIVLFAILIAGSIHAAFHGERWGVDDAFISYRYALNLVGGHGLVFNPGDPVEGYSNLLYVLVMALGLLVVPKDSVYAYSIVVNIACFSAALAIWIRYWRRRFDDRRALVAGLLFAASPLIWHAVWTGLETALVGLLFAAIFVEIESLSREADVEAPRGLLVALALMIITRADGFVIAAIAIAFLVVTARWRAGLACAVAAGSAMAAQVVFRLWYYGYPLPNTYYVKVTGALHSRLGHAWWQVTGFRDLWPYFALIVAAGLLRVWQKRKLPDALELGSFFAVGWLVYWFYVGGDIFGPRFLLVLVPVGLTAGIGVLPGVLGERSPLRPTILAVVIALLILFFQSYDFGRPRTAYDHWIEVGRFLGREHPGSVIAVDGAGKIPYFSGLKAIDMFGLNDTVIAHRESEFSLPGHSKFDPRYVYDQKPDFISAWLQGPDRGLILGLDSKEYRKQGYRLAYLVHRGPDPVGAPILDVRGKTRREIKEMQGGRAGYRYAILERVAK